MDTLYTGIRHPQTNNKSQCPEKDRRTEAVRNRFRYRQNNNR